MLSFFSKIRIKITTVITRFEFRATIRRVMMPTSGEVSETGREMKIMEVKLVNHPIFRERSRKYKQPIDSFYLSTGYFYYYLCRNTPADTHLIKFSFNLIISQKTTFLNTCPLTPGFKLPLSNQSAFAPSLQGCTPRNLQ